MCYHLRFQPKKNKSLGNDNHFGNAKANIGEKTCIRRFQQIYLWGKKNEWAAQRNTYNFILKKKTAEDWAL